MDLNIHGHKTDLGAALTDYITEKLEPAISKFSNNIVRAEVKYEKDKHNLFTATIIIHEGDIGKNFVADFKDSDPYAAFNQALDKLTAQLRKAKDKKTA